MTVDREIIEGLKDAIAGNWTRVHIQGQSWVRHDAGSPEDLLVQARQKVAELTERVDVLESSLLDIALGRPKGFKVDDEYAVAELQGHARRSLGALALKVLGDPRESVPLGKKAKGP